VRLLWIGFGALVVWLVYRSLSAMSGTFDLVGSPGDQSSDVSSPAEIDGVPLPDTKPKATLQGWAAAVAQFENAKASLNNPGDLRYDPNLAKPGYVESNATGEDSRGFATFGSLADGFDALKRQLAAYLREMPGATLAQAMAKYAPKQDGNNPDRYASYVAQQLGVSTTDTLQQIFGTGA
jgi:hypothetical protein